MDAVIAKLPFSLNDALEGFTARSRKTRSQIVREALESYLAAEQKALDSQFSKKMSRYTGTFDGGPSDLSTNPDYLKDFGSR